MAGIRDVARLAHVSTSTVSLVLNKSGYVSDKTREKVETAMRELNYIPNELARNLYHSKTNIVGLILPDIPYEEKDEFDGICKKYDLDLVSMIAPTSHDRISMIAKEANGFIYCVSSLGVTGTRSKITTDIGAMTKLVKAATDTPCAIGFGISTPEQAKEMAAHADGVIVGSAIVKLCAKYGRDCVPYIKDYVASMKDAIR